MAGGAARAVGGIGEGEAEGGPGFFEGGFVGEGWGRGGTRPYRVEFTVGIAEEFGEVNFGGILTKEAAVKDELGGVAFFLDEGFEAAIDGAVAEDGPDVDIGGGVEAVDAVDGLLEFMLVPRVSDLEPELRSRSADAQCAFQVGGEGGEGFSDF